MKKYFQAPWRLKDMFIILGIVVFTIIAANFALYFAGIPELIEKSDFKSIYLLGLFLIQTLLIILPLILFTWKKYKLHKADFGFNKIGVRKGIFAALGAYLIYIGIIIVITIFVLNFNLQIPGYQVPERILPLFGDDVFSIVIAGIIVIGIAPFAEEIFFRGFLLRTLSNKTGIVIGSILTASVFALFHLQFQNIISIFILGMIMNSLVIRKKSIWPAIYFHILNNAIAFVVELLLVLEIIKVETVI